MHALPGVQSLSVWHGQAHFWAATLQRWVRQWASVVQGRASGFGVDNAAEDAASGGASGVAVGVVPSPVPGACVTGWPGACAGG